MCLCSSKKHNPALFYCEALYLLNHVLTVVLTSEVLLASFSQVFAVSTLAAISRLAIIKDHLLMGLLAKKRSFCTSKKKKKTHVLIIVMYISPQQAYSSNWFHGVNSRVIVLCLFGDQEHMCRNALKWETLSAAA